MDATVTLMIEMDASFFVTLNWYLKPERKRPLKRPRHRWEDNV
jgi:hypothetical protein